MPPMRPNRSVLLPTGGAQTDARLTPGQNTFAQVLASQTGLNINVVAAWELAEESGAAAQQREAAGNHDWLNVGYTDTANLGTQDSFWSNPTSAAQATAAWMAGTLSIPGFGAASAGVRAILRTAGQSADAQIAAIAASGWASSGYNGGATLRALLTGAMTQPAAGAGFGGILPPLPILGSKAVPAIGHAASSAGSSLFQGFLGLTGDIAGQLALLVVNIVKDAALAFDKLVIRPAWHWNQRAVTYYWQYELGAKSVRIAAQNWTVMPWTAVFWGAGYALLWTDPESKSLKPAPVRRTRMAHHVRSLQAIPARRTMVKPADVKSRTAKKPTPVVSSAPIRQVTTMSTTRPHTVKVTDARRSADTPATEPLRSEGANPRPPGQGDNARQEHAAGAVPHAPDRTGTSTRSGRSGRSEARTDTGAGKGGAAGRRRATPGGSSTGHGVGGPARSPETDRPRGSTDR